METPKRQNKRLPSKGGEGKETEMTANEMEAYRKIPKGEALQILGKMALDVSRNYEWEKWSKMWAFCEDWNRAHDGYWDEEHPWEGNEISMYHDEEESCFYVEDNRFDLPD